MTVLVAFEQLRLCLFQCKIFSECKIFSGNENIFKCLVVFQKVL